MRRGHDGQGGANNPNIVALLVESAAGHRCDEEIARYRSEAQERVSGIRLRDEFADADGLRLPPSRQYCFKVERASEMAGVMGAPGTALFSTADVAQISQATLRQLQWWDETGIICPDKSGRNRVYSRENLFRCIIMRKLQEKHIARQKAREVMAVVDVAERAGKRFVVVLGHIRQMGKRAQKNGYTVGTAGINVSFIAVLPCDRTEVIKFSAASVAGVLALIDLKEIRAEVMGW